MICEPHACTDLAGKACEMRVHLTGLGPENSVIARGSARALYDPPALYRRWLPLCSLLVYESLDLIQFEWVTGFERLIGIELTETHPNPHECAI